MQMPALSISKIQVTFEKSPNRILTRQQINEIIEQSIEDWQVKKKKGSLTQIPLESLGQNKILKALIDKTDLQEVDLPFPSRKIKRYTWGNLKTYEIIQSVDTKGYFSHYTAMELHGLTEQVPKTIYFNVEQPTTGGGGDLTQEGINRAFNANSRVSNNIIKFGDFRVCKLNGKNTHNLGVVNIQIDGQNINVTDIERTLIDITVRPIYSGGIGEIAKAYLEAKNISIEKIVAYLHALNFTYPYHQAIGYYLERTGNYNDGELEKLHSLPMPFKFYLNYQLKNPSYIEKWKLYVPKGF